MNNLGSKIKELRTAENLTQEKLAEELNVSFQSISRWENGISTPDISLIPTIARFFGVSTDYLFGLHDEEAETEKIELETAYWDYRKDGNLDEAYEVMQKARKLFPRDLHFCTNLAEVMDLFEGGNSGQISAYINENFSEQIHSLCTNGNYFWLYCKSDKHRGTCSKYCRFSDLIKVALKLIFGLHKAEGFNRKFTNYYRFIGCNYDNMFVI